MSKIEIDTSKVTRVEVIDETGSVLTRWDQSDVSVQLQDDGRTLKVFTRGKPGPVNPARPNLLR